MFLVLRGSLVMLFSWGFPRSLLPFHFYPHSTNVGREKNQKTGPSTSTSAGRVPDRIPKSLIGSVEEKGFEI